jgi:hypothetical protein
LVTFIIGWMRLFFITVLLIPARFVSLDLFQFDASFLLNYTEFMFCLNDLELLLLEVIRILTCLFNLLIWIYVFFYICFGLIQLIVVDFAEPWFDVLSLDLKFNLSFLIFCVWFLNSTIN